jgi:hypothetical protein
MSRWRGKVPLRETRESTAVLIRMAATVSIAHAIDNLTVWDILNAP